MILETRIPPIVSRRPSQRTGRVPESRPLDGACPLSMVVEMLEREADLRIRVLERDWDRVDAARAHFDSAGVSDRATVHHASVLEVAREIA